MTRPPGFFPVIIALAVCFAIPIYDLLRLAAANDLYSYIPLIPAISLYFVWLRRKNLPQFSEPMPKMAALFFAAGSIAIALYWSAIRSSSPATEDYLAFTLSAFLLFFAGICCLFLGREMVRALAFPLGLLIFIIPLPVAARNWLETFLQHGSAIVAGGLFTLSGMPVFQDGVKFQLPGFNLLVAPECSGIHSTLVLFITSLLAGYLFLRGPWKRAILVLAVIPLALLRNGFRIFVIGQLCVRVGPQMINSPIHRHGGPLFFALSLIPLFGLLIFFRNSEHPNGKFHLSHFQKLNMKKFHPFLTLFLACVLAIAGNGCSAKAKKLYYSQRANRYFDSGEFDKAEVEFMNVLHNDPQNTDAIGHLGIIYFDEGRFQRAAPFLFRGSQLATNNLELRLKLGTIYLSIGKLKEARDEAIFVLGQNPNDDEAPLLLAKASAPKKDIADARQRLQQLSQNHDTAAFETASGILAFREHDFKTAAADFHRAEIFDSEFAGVYPALGILDWAQNDLTQAETAFKTGAELSPPRSQNSVQYAQFEIQTGHLLTAKAILEDMTKETPDYVPAWMGLAEIALAETNYDDCSAMLGTALARDPGDYDALLLQGRLDLARGQTATAIGELEQLAKTYPQASRVQYQLAVAYLVSGDAGKSIANLNRAVTLDPNFSDAILLLAGLEIRNGNPNSAIAALEQLIRQQPQLIKAKLFLADADRVQGDFNGALVIYQALEKSSPKNPEVPLLMGSTLLE
ncbi:MAG: exosortase, partial [Limisphaerales bacterium]